MKKIVSWRHENADAPLAVNLNAEQLAQEVLEHAIEGLGIVPDVPPTRRQSAYLTVIEDLIIAKIDDGLCANATVGESSEALFRLVSELIASHNTDPIQPEPHAEQSVH